MDMHSTGGPQRKAHGLLQDCSQSQGVEGRATSNQEAGVVFDKNLLPDIKQELRIAT
jgi:hypothetical protein